MHVLMMAYKTGYQIESVLQTGERYSGNFGFLYFLDEKMNLFLKQFFSEFQFQSILELSLDNKTHVTKVH